MKISEIKNNQGSINVEADVVEVGPVREFNKYGKNLRVANAVLMDESGKIKLTLWNDEISKVHEGDRVKITNGYAKAFQDELQLTAGKFGKIEVVGKAQGNYSDEKSEEAESEGVETEKVRKNFDDSEDEDEDYDSTSDEEEW